MAAKPRGSYGVDAPWVPWFFIGTAVVAAGAAMGFALWAAEWWTIALSWYLALCAAVFVVGAVFYWHATSRGKFVIWDRLLRESAPPAGARMLDLGCGRGAVAIMAATRFPTLEVTGVDLWRTRDQSGNSLQSAIGNAGANAVEDRIRFDTGDMTRLPYSDGSFDLVTANLSIHNIPTEDGRRLAIQEAVRVLAPAGRLIIVDFQHTGEFAAELRRLRTTVTGPTKLGWNGWWNGPWMTSRVVQAVPSSS